MVLQLQVAQCQTSFVLFFVLPFCFTYLHYDSITFGGFLVFNLLLYVNKEHNLHGVIGLLFS
jgi:hypothetical protein